MPRSAIVAEAVTGEPREQLVAFLNLGKLSPPALLSAAVAYRTLLAGNPGAADVRAMLVALEAGAFTPVALGTGADADLVNPTGLGAGRDKPLTAAQVLELFAVKLEKTGAAKDVGWLWFGGGVVRWVR